MEEGETFEQGLQRELLEELGLDVAVTEPHVFLRKRPFTSSGGEEFLSDERYYVVMAPDETVVFDNMSADERALTKEGKWWSVADIRASDEEFFAEDLDAILADILDGNLPVSPQEI